MLGCRRHYFSPEQLKKLANLAYAAGYSSKNAPQPIETAPKDGSTIVVIFGRQSGFPAKIVRWDNLHNIWTSYGEWVPGLENNATHWMPIPAVESDLISKVEQLQIVCAEAYQLAGALGAPVSALDNLSAAANGQSIPHDTFLPVLQPCEIDMQDAFDERESKLLARIEELEQDNDALRKDAARWRHVRENGVYDLQFEYGECGVGSYRDDAADAAIDSAMKGGE